MTIDFQNYLFTDAGAAVSGATVDLLTRNTTTPVLSTTTTSAAGLWTINYATQGRYDVRITNGSSVRWHKYDAMLQLDTLEVANFRVRNPGDTFEYDIVPGAITAARTLNLPVITTTDTLVVTTLAQTLASKTLTSPTITTSPTAAGATWTNLGTVTTADINGGTLDGTVIGGASAAAVTATTLTTGGATSLTGGDTTVGNGYGIVVGHTAQVAAGVTAEFQVTGTAAADSAIGLNIFSADAQGPSIRSLKSRGAAGAFNVVSSGDELLIVAGYGADGTDAALSGIIRLEVDGTPGAGDMPGRWVVLTSADGTESPTEAIRWDAAQRTHIQASGTPDVALEVSNGASTGGGTVHAATVTTHSQAELKSDINYLPDSLAEQAFRDVLTIKPATFRYRRNIHGTKSASRSVVRNGKQVEEVIEVEDRGVVVGRVADPSMPLMKGLIYEDSPESIRASHGTIDMSLRILNLEMAVKHMAGKLGLS